MIKKKEKKIEIQHVLAIFMNEGGATIKTALKYKSNVFCKRNAF